MPRGVEFKIPMQDALEAHQAHLQGWSLRALSRLHYRQWGYASPGSCLEGLRGVFRALDLPVRARVDATVLAHELHGNSRRAAAKPGHPDHDAFLAQRRFNRARQVA